MLRLEDVEASTNRRSSKSSSRSCCARRSRIRCSSIVVGDDELLLLLVVVVVVLLLEVVMLVVVEGNEAVDGCTRSLFPDSLEDNRLLLLLDELSLVLFLSPFPPTITYTRSCLPSPSRSPMRILIAIRLSV